MPLSVTAARCPTTVTPSASSDEDNVILPSVPTTAFAVEWTAPMRRTDGPKSIAWDSDSDVAVMLPSSAQVADALAVVRPAVAWSLAGPPASARPLEVRCPLSASTEPPAFELLVFGCPGYELVAITGTELGSAPARPTLPAAASLKMAAA
jgi:hypothetical protein